MSVERIEGPSLAELVQARPWTLFSVARQFAEIAAALRVGFRPPADLTRLAEWIDGIQAKLNTWPKPEEVKRPQSIDEHPGRRRIVPPVISSGSHHLYKTGTGHHRLGTKNYAAMHRGWCCGPRICSRMRSCHRRLRAHFGCFFKACGASFTASMCLGRYFLRFPPRPELLEQIGCGRSAGKAATALPAGMTWT